MTPRWLLALPLILLLPFRALGQVMPPRPFADDILYLFMPIAWRDSDNDAQHFGDFDGMTASLDYLQSLGVTGVWMTPIFPSPAYHGYQHGVADQLNPWFGTQAQFLNFVQQAHARGIKVFLDFVAYGISQKSLWFQNAFNNPTSPYTSWFAFTNAQNTAYQGSVYTTWNGATVGFINWRLTNTNPVDLDVSWARKWLDPNGDGNPADGIDGYRADHVYSNSPECCGADIDFWKTWTGAIHSAKPGALAFAEQADWGTTGVDILPAFDAAFTKPWEFAVRDALVNETTSGLYSQTLATYLALPPGRQFLGTIGDHDVDRITSVLGGSSTKARVAAAIHMTSPFPPIIYFGDEIGMLGMKGNFGSDANDIPNREPFKWNKIAGPPMSNYWILNSQAYNARYSHDNDGRSVEEQRGLTGSLLEEYRKLVLARKTNIALRSGQYIPIPNNNTRVWSFLRHQPGQQTLLVAIRIRNSAASVTFNLSGTTILGGSTTVRDILTNQSLPNLTDANKSAYAFNMPAYSYTVLEVNLAPTPPALQEVDGIDIPAGLTPAALYATQTSPTNLGDNISELDQLFVRPKSNGLRIGITGDLAADGTGLAILLDTTTGGQNVLNFSGFSPPPSGPDRLTGLRLDAGFSPDHMLFINTANSTIYVDQFTLPTSGSVTKTYRGQGSLDSGNGSLTGGTNPNGMLVALDNTNGTGVTDTDAFLAPSARNGLDLYIPYADLGISGLGGSVGVAAFICKSDGRIGNQWLPPVGPGYYWLGVAPDMTVIPGDQFVAVPLRIPGDVDGNGIVDANDVAAFVNVLLGLDSNPAHVTASDLNQDGGVNGDDIGLFIMVATNPSP